MVLDQEFADDTSLYFQGHPENLEKAKDMLTEFSLASGVNINWDKSYTLWISMNSSAFSWGETGDSSGLKQGTRIDILVFNSVSK